MSASRRPLLPRPSLEQSDPLCLVGLVLSDKGVGSSSPVVGRRQRDRTAAHSRAVHVLSDDARCVLSCRSLGAVTRFSGRDWGNDTGEGCRLSHYHVQYKCHSCQCDFVRVSYCLFFYLPVQGAYPARLKKVLVVTAPLWFKAPFKILRLFVREKLRDRVYTVSLPQVMITNGIPAQLHARRTARWPLFMEKGPNQNEFHWHCHA